MKMPGWLILESEHVEGDNLVCTMRIRRWHPGFWLFVIRTLLRPTAAL